MVNLMQKDSFPALGRSGRQSENSNRRVPV